MGAAFSVGLSLAGPVEQVANPEALQLLRGSLWLALLGCLMLAFAPRAGFWLALGGLGQAYVLVPLSTPLLTRSGTFDLFAYYWGDSRFGLLTAVAATAGLLAGLARRGQGGWALAPAVVLAYLSLPFSLRLVELGQLPALLELGLLGGLLAWLRWSPRLGPHEARNLAGIALLGQTAWTLLGSGRPPGDYHLLVFLALTFAVASVSERIPQLPLERDTMVDVSS